MKKAAISLLLFIFVAVSFAQSGVRPLSGFVPNEETAVKIAEAVLIPIYGEKKIAEEKPFHASRKGEVWTVTGTLYCSDGKGGRTTQNCAGGVAMVEISKSDARILSMGHGK